MINGLSHVGNGVIIRSWNNQYFAFRSNANEYDERFDDRTHRLNRATNAQARRGHVIARGHVGVFDSGHQTRVAKHTADYLDRTAFSGSRAVILVVSDR